MCFSLCFFFFLCVSISLCFSLSVCFFISLCVSISLSVFLFCVFLFFVLSLSIYIFSLILFLFYSYFVSYVHLNFINLSYIISLYILRRIFNHFTARINQAYFFPMSRKKRTMSSSFEIHTVKNYRSFYPVEIHNVIINNCLSYIERADFCPTGIWHFIPGTNFIDAWQVNRPF